MSASDRLPPSLIVIRGNRLEFLRDQMIALLKADPLPPLEDEVFLVQSNGIAQWLKLALADSHQGCGVAAGVDMILPARLQWRAYRSVLGDLPESSPLEKSTLVWRLYRLWSQVRDLAPQPLVQQDSKLALADDSLLDPPNTSALGDLAPVYRFLQSDRGDRRRWQLARQVADLFDQYQVYRGDWLSAWAVGQDVLIDAAGQSQPLPTEQRWQAAVWRMVLQDLPEELRELGRADIHQRFLAAVEQAAAEWIPLGLPRRVLVFGISSLPRQILEVLAALSRWLPVLMFVHSPRCLDGDSATAGHPLLASWGRQGHDFLNLLNAWDHPKHYQQSLLDLGLQRELFQPAGEDGHPPSLLHQLQNELLQGRAVSHTTEAPVVAAQDRSLMFHVAHSPQREVEILHDQLLEAFHTDPSLRPRDVMVMVPEIHNYAPHIQAVFGQLEPDDLRFIPYTIADQASGQELPVAQALAGLLSLDDCRLTVSQVLDWLEIPAVRAAAGIEAGELPRLQRWIQDSGIRWALDADHRRQFGPAGDRPQNTWHFGLQRMLLGYAVGDGEAWNEIQPYPAVGGLEAALAGRLAQWLQRLQAWHRTLNQPAPPDQWATRLRQLLEQFLLPQTSADQNTLDRLHQALERWLDDCQNAELQESLPLAVVREPWLAVLQESRLSQRFLGGAVNFATLMPMRAIPFKRIYLLGMNDGDFPRPSTLADFDLLAIRGQYRPGDRSRAEDDRYLFLEAILSARQALAISWIGRGNRDNAARPPSVLVAQLREHLSRGWRAASSDGPVDKQDLADALTVEHPLQPFSRDYFAGDPDRFTYAWQWREIHEPPPTAELSKEPSARRPSGSADGPTEGFATGDAAHAHGSRPAVGFSGSDRGWQPTAPITLRDLADFLRDPVDMYFKHVLQVRVWEEAAFDWDSEPFELAGLAKWSAADQILQPLAARLVDDPYRDPRADLLQALQRLIGEGRLPWPPFAQTAHRRLAEVLESQLTAFASLRQVLQPAALPAFSLELPAAEEEEAHWVLADTLDQIFQDSQTGDRVRLQITASDLKSGADLRFRHVVRYWPQHLALCWQCGSAAQTHIVHAGPQPLVLPGLARDEADRHLQDLLQAFRQGMEAPLPVACETACAYLNQRSAVGDDQDWPVTARRAYEGGDFRHGECQRSSLLARCFPDFNALLDSGQFTEWAQRLYGPLHQLLQGQVGPRMEGVSDDWEDTAAC